MHSHNHWNYKVGYVLIYCALQICIMANIESDSRGDWLYWSLSWYALLSFLMVQNSDPGYLTEDNCPSSPPPPSEVELRLRAIVQQGALEEANEALLWRMTQTEVHTFNENSTSTDKDRERDEEDTG